MSRVPLRLNLNALCFFAQHQQHDTIGTGETFVYVADRAEASEGLVVRQQPVQLGRIEGNHYQVMTGVKPGEQIAVTGLLQLSDGATIVPES